MQQAGTFSLGSSSAKLAQITVVFAQPFAAVPVVVANTLQVDPNYPPGTIADTFAVSITGASQTGFQANIFRVDLPSGNGWDQNLSIGYIATA